MINGDRPNHEEHSDITPPADDYIAPAPRVSVQAFCATVATAATARAASEDRRLGKVHLSVHMGGIAAAIDTYHTAPTPNVIVLETEAGIDILAVIRYRSLAATLLSRHSITPDLSETFDRFVDSMLLDGTDPAGPLARGLVQDE